MESEPPRKRTSAATYKRRMTKWRRWAKEMQDNGWNGGQPIPEPAAPRETEQ